MDDTYILNALELNVHFKALGNHFTMKPGQIKRFSKDIGDYIAKDKAYLGLVALDDRFDDPDFKATEEGQSFLATKKAEGVQARVRHLKMLVDNALISLPQDLAMAEMKVDAKTLMSDGEIAAMEELRGLQRVDNDRAKLRLEKVRALERQLNAGNGSASSPKKD
jgi:hypothetical protein